MRPPLYPAVLSALYSFLPHESYLTARLFNTAVDLLACLVFYKLIMLVWGDRLTAGLSSVVYAVNPLVIFFCVRVRVEALYALLLVTGVYILVYQYKKRFPRPSSVFVAGVIFGLASLCRSNASPMVMLIPIWLVYLFRRKLRTGIVLAAVFVIGSALVIAPWSIRNYITYGELILITDGLGYNLWISNGDVKRGDLDATTYEEYISADKVFWQKTFEFEKQLEGKSLRERDRFYLEAATNNVSNDIGRWIWLTTRKTAEFWWPMARVDMQGIRAYLTLPFGLLMYLGLFFYVKGFFDGSYDRNILWLFGVLIVTASVTGILTWSSVRFRVPLVDPYMIPFGMYWLSTRFFDSFGRDRIP
jgi:hypothetical protein